jgi:GntR family transcriptional regulator
MLDKESKIPLYSQLMDILIHEIQNYMQEDEKMLSEREICKKYDVSRTTVRQTFQELEREGYIYIKHGKGAFVASNKYNQNLQGFYSFTEEMKRLGKEPTSKVIKFEIITSNNDIAKKMNIESEDLVYKFTRLRLANGEKMMVETTYVPYNLFPGITKDDLNKNPLYDIFKDRFNAVVEYAEEVFIPVLTNEDEAEKLNIGVGSPSLKISRFAYNNSDKIIEYTISIARGDKFRYNIKLLKK